MAKPFIRLAGNSLTAIALKAVVGCCPWSALLALLTILITGCTIPRRHGDALVYDRKDLLLVAVDDLVFPWMRLDSRRTYHFEARRLPWAVYPDRIDLRYRHEARRPPKSEYAEHLEPRISRDEIQGTNQVWRQTSLKIRFQKTDGQPFFERMIKLETQSAGPYYDDGRGTAVLSFLSESVRRSLPDITNYDVEVEVVSPAEKSPIEARLFTQKKIY